MFQRHLEHLRYLREHARARDAPKRWRQNLAGLDARSDSTSGSGQPNQATVIDDEPNPATLSKPELVRPVKELRNARTTDVIHEDKTMHNDVHPTMKPVGLITRMLANSTRRGDWVIDPFAGSGSTLVAAELLERRAALIELDPGYADVIVQRWRTLRPTEHVVRVRDGESEGID